MKREDFNKRLKELNLNKAILAELTGYNVVSVRRWDETPLIIDSWLELYEKAKKYDVIMEQLGVGKK